MSARVLSIIVAPILFLLFSSLTVFAETPEAGTANQAAPAEAVNAATFNSPYEEVISQTSHSIGLQGGYGFKLWQRHNFSVAEALPYIAFPITGPVGKTLRGVLEYKVEGTIGVITQLDDRIIAGGSPVGLRYNFTGLGGRLVPYSEVTLGAVYANMPRNIQGSRFDFILSFGLGAQYFISRRTTVNLEFRYWHLSDAGIKEPNQGDNLGFVLVGMGFY